MRAAFKAFVRRSQIKANRINVVLTGEERNIVEGVFSNKTGAGNRELK